MEKNEEKVLEMERNLEQKHFENVTEAIEGVKENGGSINVELIENLVESYKGKTVQTPIEVILTSAIFLNMRELMNIIETLKHVSRVKMVEELKEKVDKGESTVEDAVTALMIAVSMKKESEKD